MKQRSEQSTENEKRTFSLGEERDRELFEVPDNLKVMV